MALVSDGAAGGDRTHDPWLRRPILYPLSYSRAEPWILHGRRRPSVWHRPDGYNLRLFAPRIMAVGLFAKFGVRALAGPSEDTMSDNAHDSHTGPVKTPTQLLWLSFFSFVIPVFVIIGLVHFVTSAPKPAAGAVDVEIALAKRIQPVGSVELRDANRPLQAGDAVYKAQCAACHDAGLAGAPKFGDAGAWTGRLASGYESLLKSALEGKGAMGAQAGGAFSDLEIGRAVVHLANSAGASFAEPNPPAPAE